jgi:plastocyanin
MSRVSVVRRSGAATLAAGFALLAGAFTAMLIASPSAHAVTREVDLSYGTLLGSAANLGTVDVTTGDTVAFTAISGKSHANTVKIYPKNPPGGPPSATISVGTSYNHTFGSAGSATYSWTAYTAGVQDGSGLVKIEVSDPPPPPPSSDTPTPSDTPTDNPTDTGTPTGTGTATGTATGTPTGTGTAAGPGGGSTAPPGGGGGISFPHTSTIPNNPIVGFAPPPRDPNGATPTVDPGDLGSGKGSIPGGLPSSDSPDGTATDINGQPVLADKVKPVKVPTALAIASIAALAAVSSVFAFRQLGQRTH